MPFRAKKQCSMKFRNQVVLQPQKTDSTAKNIFRGCKESFFTQKTTQSCPFERKFLPAKLTLLKGNLAIFGEVKRRKIKSPCDHLLH